MEVSLTNDDGEVLRVVKLLDFTADVARHESLIVWRLAGALEDLRAKRTAELGALLEAAPSGAGVAAYKVRELEVLAELQDFDDGIVGYLLAKVLHDPPTVPKGDLTPVERGLPVTQALMATGWARDELQAVFRLALEQAEKAATGAGKTTRRVQAHLDFSPPQTES